MKIIELRAENVKRLKAVRIEPDGTMQVIGGANGAGKSSVLDAVWLALGGRDASNATTRPIRDGEQTASVTLNLGEHIVERTWSAKSGTSKLTVKSKDGATYSRPQERLNAIVGRLSFDPLEFTRMDNRKQRDALLGLLDLPIDLDALDGERAALYDARRLLGQQRKALGAIPVVSPDAPTEEQSAADVLRRIADGQEHNRLIEERKARLSWMDSDHERVSVQVERLRAELAEAEQKLADIEKGREEARDALRAAGSPVDLTALERELDGLEAVNAAARANRGALDKAAEADALDDEYAAKTAAIEQVDRQKSDALAEASMPIPGLGIDEDGLTFNGVPLAQASSAEQIRVSVAMGMALNPRLRVLMVRDGSLLDEEAMIAIRDQVKGGDFQLLIERVGDGDEGAVIIEDGEVAG